MPSPAPAVPNPLLAVGDPRRAAAGRAIVSTLAVALFYFAFTIVVKEARPLGAHAPWQDDPYDAAISFSLFFVPLMAVLTALRVQLCRRDAPLPARRLRDLLRSSRVILGVVVITLSSEWISVGLGADQDAWSNVTPILVAGLAAVSGAAAWAVLAVWTSRLPGRMTSSEAQLDWLADMVTLAEIRTSWLGPMQKVAARLVHWADRRVVMRVRRGPVAAAAGTALLFGAAVAVNHAIEEGAGGAAMVIFFAAAAAGMFAFLVAAGAYIGLVRRSRPAGALQRRLTDASVFAAAGVLVALALRNSLWWLIDATAARARPGELMELLSVAAIVVFTAVFAIESLARVHSTASR